MPGEEAGGALGSFGDILDSGEVPALTLGLWVGGAASALTLVLPAGGGSGAADSGSGSGNTAGGGSDGVG